MGCELDYSILTEDVTREIEAVMREYDVRREIEDEDVSEDEFSTEDDSDGETLNDNRDLEFDFSETDISERSRQSRSCYHRNEEFIDCRNNCTELRTDSH